jgi:hypothetical protein
MRLLPPPGFDSKYGGNKSVGNVGKTACCQTARESQRTRPTVPNCWSALQPRRYKVTDKVVNDNQDINSRQTVVQPSVVMSSLPPSRFPISGSALTSLKHHNHSCLRTVLPHSHYGVEHSNLKYSASVSMVQEALPPRYGASSGCGQRNGLQICSVAARGQPTMGGPPAREEGCLGENLTILDRKIVTRYERKYGASGLVGSCERVNEP